MEWTIPIQTFETSKVKLGSPVHNLKLMAPLAYSDGDLKFHNLSILLPLLTVKSYEPHSGRLLVTFQSAQQSLNKLQSLQDMLLSAIYNQQKNWFPTYKYKSYDELRGGFQPFIDQGVLHLYCPSEANDIHVYKNRTWVQGPLSGHLLAPDAPIRLAIRVQGISFHQHSVSGMWTGRFRIQHRIIAIFVGDRGQGQQQPPPPPLPRLA